VIANGNLEMNVFLIGTLCPQLSLKDSAVEMLPRIMMDQEVV